jgi:hypothetical protein
VPRFNQTECGAPDPVDMQGLPSIFGSPREAEPSPRKIERHIHPAQP